MLPLVLETLVQSVDTKVKSMDPFPWVEDEPTEEDLDLLKKEALGDSNFDPLKLRRTMYEGMLRDEIELVCKRGPFAKVIALVRPGDVVPWDTFSRIFQAFGPPMTKEFWRVFFFANPIQRTLPSEGEELSSKHINGGYTYPCDPSCVVVYRLEECDRVLIHELLHASCTDDMTQPEEIRECLTETWAELFLVAIRARGSLKKAAGLWNRQARWIANQEAVLRKRNNVNVPSDYAWRYTVSRRSFLETLGISLPNPSRNPLTELGGSSRFTCI
jgi:hypothetical protein